jgi:hypothetical protein
MLQVQQNHRDSLSVGVTQNAIKRNNSANKNPDYLETQLIYAFFNNICVDFSSVAD